MINIYHLNLGTKEKRKTTYRSSTDKIF